MTFLSKFLSFGSSKAKSSSENGAATVSNNSKANGAVASSTAVRTFGKELRKDFLFDPKYLNLNHGSFGTYPSPVRTALRHYQDLVELRPDDFIRYQYPALVDKSREAMANLLNAPVETIVIIPNASTGVNTVLRNLRFEEGDVIIYFDTTYGACEKVIAYITETTRASSAKVKYTYPISDAELVKRFRETVEAEKKEGRNVKIALFDTVCSMPGVKMPYEELSKACKELGVMSLVDGAHGVGHLDLDLEKLDFDFFTSNCHKWLLTPRACAVFYVPVRNQALMRSSLPTSHGFVPESKPGVHILNPFDTPTKSPFVYNFQFVGSLDTSAYLTIPHAIEYRESLGGEAAVRKYTHDLARQAGKRVAEIVGTEVMENEEGTLGNCGMTNVRLPLDKEEITTLVQKAGKEVDEYDMGKYVRDWLTMQFVKEHNAFMAITVLYGGAWWVRLSAAVYLDLDDFEVGARMLKDECDRVKKGEFLDWLATKL